MISGHFVLFDALFNPARIPCAVGAVLLSACIGLACGPAGANANPFFWHCLDILLGKTGDRLGKTDRSQADLAVRGCILTLTALALGAVVILFFRRIQILIPVWGAADVLFLSALLSSGAYWRVLIRLYRGKGQARASPGLYLTLARTTRTDLNASDEFGLARVATNHLARLFDKGLMGPVFWYVVAGIPASCVYAALAALTWRFGKAGFAKGIGDCMLFLERLAGFIPGVLSGVFLALAAAFTPTAGPFKAFSAFCGVRGRSPYEQGGWPLSVTAWALKISLGGPSTDLTGSALQSVWAGPDKASAKIAYKDISRALVLTIVAHLLLILALSGLYAVLQHAGLDFNRRFP